jgi:hypothetical protein
VFMGRLVHIDSRFPTPLPATGRSKQIGIFKKQVIDMIDMIDSF